MPRRIVAAACIPTLLFAVASVAAPKPLPGDKPNVDPKEKKPFLTTKSGLKFRVLTEDDGKAPGPTDTVTVHYRGWLDDGTVFDDSRKRGQPTTFPLSGVIKGWQEGLQLVPEGGTIELVIPPDLGYGERGAGNVIPGNATLHFHVELIRIGAKQK